MKSYKQFIRESKESDLLWRKPDSNHDLDIDDIRDMGLDLVDNDFDVKVWNINYYFTVLKEDTKMSKLWGESIHVPAVCVKLKDSQGRFFSWDDIIDFTNRLIIYLGELYEIIINWSQDDYKKLDEFIDVGDTFEEYYVLEIIIYKKLDY
jgi:hypothetical protein